MQNLQICFTIVVCGWYVGGVLGKATSFLLLTDWKHSRFLVPTEYPKNNLRKLNMDLGNL